MVAAEVFFIGALLTNAGIAETPGTIIVARTGSDALLLWDATPLVADIVSEKRSRVSALRDLEAQAMQILSARAATMADAKRLTIRVLYQKTGAVSPVYGTPTLEGVERVFELTAEKDRARKNGTAYSRALSQGRVPPGLHLLQTGDLPPP